MSAMTGLPQTPQGEVTDASMPADRGDTEPSVPRPAVQLPVAVRRPMRPPLTGDRMLEEWRPIPGYEGRYDVSSEGRLRSHLRGSMKIKKPVLGPQGYLGVKIYRDGAAIFRTVHCLVALAFYGPRPEGNIQVRHLNGIKTDNRLANLAYGTASENQLDAVRLGEHYCATRTHCPQGHPYDEDNTYRGPGGRRCRACERVRDRLRGSGRKRRLERAGGAA